MIGVLGDRALVGRLISLLDRHRRQAWSKSDAIKLAATSAAVLGRLGGREVEAPLMKSAGDDAFPEIQAAALTALGRICPRRAATLFDRLAGADSFSRAVVVAARGARANCRKRWSTPR